MNSSDILVGELRATLGKLELALGSVEDAIVELKILRPLVLKVSANRMSAVEFAPKVPKASLMAMFPSLSTIRMPSGLL